MAPKAVKRPAPVERSPQASKAQKMVHEPPNLTIVLDAIQKMPEHCKMALVSFLPGNSTQHDAESIILKMVSDVVRRTQPRIQQEIEAGEETISTVGEKKSTLDESVVEAEVAYAHVLELTKAKHGVAAEALKFAAVKSLEAIEALRVQQKGDKILESARAEKLEYEAALANNFKALCDGADNLPACKAHIQVMSPLVAKIDVDESMVAALPTTFAKPPSARGPFDKIVIEQLEKLLGDHIAHLATTLASGDASTVERAAVVIAAETEADAAQETRDRAHEEHSNAQVLEREAASKLAGAKAVVTQFLADCKNLEKQRDERVRALKSFEAWNTKCFAEISAAMDSDVA